MLKKLIESLYDKVFINIVASRFKTIVYIEIINNEEVTQNTSQSFNTTTINAKMQEYIKSYTNRSPYYYISVLDTSPTQGAIPTCVDASLSKYADTSSSKVMCYKDIWSYHTLQIDLSLMLREYKAVGLDFVFSQFTVLHHFFKQKIDTSLALFILTEENYMALCVFEKSTLLYSDYLNLEYDESEDLLAIEEDLDELELDIVQKDEDKIDLETIDLDDVNAIENLEDFGNIESLDNLENMDNLDQFDGFKEEIEEVQEVPIIQEVEDVSDEVEDEDIGFNEDYQRFMLIQSSINNFYQDDRFKSSFLETTYIADSTGGNGDLKRYLEEEMLLSVHTRQIDLAMEICELAKVELI